MLVDSWKIAKALKEVGTATASRSSAVATPGRSGGPCIRVTISDSLNISIIPVEPDEMVSLWTFRQGNFHFWPVYRVARTLCADDECNRVWNLPEIGDKNNGPNLRRTEVRAARPDASYLFDGNQGESAERAFHHAKITAVDGDLFVLSERLKRLSLDREKLQMALMQGSHLSGMSDFLFGLFFGKMAKGSIEANGQIAFDLYERTIYTQYYRDKIEQKFGEDDDITDSDGPLRLVCALAGNEQPRFRGKFPNPSLPIAASGIPMFSMFSGAPTNTRYGLSDSAILSIGTKTVQEAHDALLHVTKPEFENRHWRKLANGKKKDGRELADLLIAYADGVDVATIIDEDGDADQNRAELYDISVRRVMEALSGLFTRKPDAEVLLVILRQISNAQVQSVYCRTPKAKAVYDAVEKWRSPQESRPRLLVEKAGGERRYVTPGAVVRLLRKTWVDAPPRPVKLAGPSGGDILDFFLADGIGRERVADYLLALTLQRTEKLCQHYGNENRLSKTPADGQETRRNKQAATGSWAEADRVMFFISILLNAKGINMDTITRSPQYQIGLLLGLVNTLHAAYHLVERNEGEPRSLGGTALLGIAADNPSRALAELTERLPAWHDWAETTARRPTEGDKLTKEEKGAAFAIARAKKSLKRLSLVASSVAGHVTDERMTDQGKAELLLGFLSRDEEADNLETQEA